MGDPVRYAQGGLIPPPPDGHPDTIPVLLPHAHAYPVPNPGLGRYVMQVYGQDIHSATIAGPTVCNSCGINATTRGVCDECTEAQRAGRPRRSSKGKQGQRTTGRAEH